MAKTTQLELVTPARVMVQKAVEMVVAPGVEGLFGVLPRHAPLLAELARGVIEVHENGKIINPEILAELDVNPDKVITI